MSANKSSTKIYSADDFPTYLPKLNSLYDDLFSDGKGFRSKLVNRIGAKIGLESNVMALLAQTVEFIHNASLLHDDLIDHSVLRRGKPAAWSKYTPEYAVLAGDYLLARVMVNLSAHGNVRLIQRTAKAISDLLEGEWIQDSLVKDFGISASDLDRVHDLKTGSLFKWCLSAPFIARDKVHFSGNTKAGDAKDLVEEKLLMRLEECGTLLGLLFQRSDDLLDFDIRNDEGKAVLGDLKSGYLNSFAVRVLRDLPKSSLDGAIASQSLGEFKTRVGEVRFRECAEAFDQENQKLIDLYFHRLNGLRDGLEPSEQGVLEVLQGLPKPLYWRKREG